MAAAREAMEQRAEALTGALVREERVGELLLGAVPLAVQRVGIGLGYHVMEQLVRQHPGGGVGAVQDGAVWGGQVVRPLPEFRVRQQREFPGLAERDHGDGVQRGRAAVQQAAGEEVREVGHGARIRSAV
ncbi:MAG: hypothetical protein Q7T33_01215 [Dehalococcoidia bacterium]|nr:hypothetical protein [Dehalococcoidia bacterium]